MQPDEASALGRLAGDAVAGTSRHVRRTHLGIAERVWRSVGPASAPVRVVHDGVASVVYEAVERLAPLVPRAAGRAVGMTIAANAPSLQRSRTGRRAVGLLNAAVGDRLARQGSPLAVRTSVRVGGSDVVVSPDALSASFPRATDRIAVFVHGLGQTEEAWGSEGGFGELLRADLGYTPVFVRYNTGVAAAVAGRELSELLDAVVSAWSVPVSEIALIGHSLGGLVARAACFHGAGTEWVGRVRDVVTLATPHDGVALERAAGALSATLARLPETRGVGLALGHRSDGMKDFALGAREVPYLEGADHYFLSASLGEGQLGRALGDLVVRRRSAWNQRGRGARVEFPVDHYREIGGVGHFGILRSPAVYAVVRGWLGARRALPGPVVGLPAGEHD